MRLKFTFFLVALNVVAFGIILLLENRPVQPEPSSIGLAGLLGREIVEADRIELRRAGQQEARVLERSGSKWRIVEPFQWAANFYAVNKILNQLQFLESRAAFTLDEIARSGQTLADFGLDDPRLTMVIGNERESITLKIGVNTEVGNNVYLLGPGGKQVYVIDKQVVSELSIDPNDLRMTEVFDIPVFEVDTLSLEVAAREANQSGDRKIRLARVKGGWLFESPISAVADPSLVNNAINKLTSLKAQRFIEPEAVDPILQGLETPSMRVTLQGNRRRATLLLGKSDTSANEPHYYAKLENNPTVFTVPAKPFDDLRSAEDALRQRNFMDFDSENVSLVEISQNGKEVRLQQLESGGWQVIGSGNGSDVEPYRVDVDIMQDFARQLINLRASGFAIDAPSAEDLERLGFNAPRRSVRIEDGSEEPFVLTLAHPADDNAALFVRTNRAPYIYAVDRQATLSVLPLNALYFRDRVVARMPEAAIIQELKIEDLRSGETYFARAIDPERETWGTALAERPQAEQDAVFNLIEQLRTFRVDSFRYTGFTENAQLDQRTDRPWAYRISGTVYLPGGTTSTRETRSFVTTERLGGSLQIGGSAQLDLVFNLSQEMIDTLHVFTDSITPPPEAEDQPLPETTRPEAVQTTGDSDDSMVAEPAP